MDEYDAAEQLSMLLEGNRSVFLKTEPEVPDHTDRAPFKILLFGQGQKLDLDVTPENVMDVVAMLDSCVFTKECVDRLYCWNLKSLATYFHAFCPNKYLNPATSILDLKVIESFLSAPGLRKKSPENLNECIHRMKLAVSHKGWLPVYKSIHLPLTLRVLPSIETTPLLDEAAKRCVYPYYEIEGQISGRMNCLKKFAKSYLPHNMGPDVRAVLKPRGYGLRFMYTDFRHCEISVLQWLSGDEKLKELLDTSPDVYPLIYKAITGDECNTDTKRKMAKVMIIAVLYGSGAATLGETLKIPETVAKELINRIRVVFKTACDWMNEQTAKAKSGIFMDYFGRPRDFSAKPYSAPDIMVQGVAATVCQEKLIDLFAKVDGERTQIVHVVHDGIGLVVKLEAARASYGLVKETLEEESKLCPGLKMKVEVKFGAKLDGMKVLWRD